MQDKYSFHIYLQFIIHTLYIHNLCIKYRFKSIPVPPFPSMWPAWNKSSRLRFQLLPWHLSKFFPFFHLPPLLFSSIPFFFFALPLPHCPWWFQLKTSFLWQRNPSLVYVRSTAISTVLFAPSLFSLVHISTVFIRDNFRPKDLKNFP